jgi:hypothetical protein
MLLEKYDFGAQILICNTGVGKSVLCFICIMDIELFRLLPDDGTEIDLVKSLFL